MAETTYIKAASSDFMVWAEMSMDLLQSESNFTYIFDALHQGG
jgi:hypothetical protein